MDFINAIGFFIAGFFAICLAAAIGRLVIQLLLMALMATVGLVAISLIGGVVYIAQCLQ